MDTARQVQKELVALLEAWEKLYHRWWLAHYIIGISGLVSAITAAAQPRFLVSVPHLLAATAWCAAICMGLVTFMMPSRQAKIYVSAWRVLSDAVNRYRMEDNFTVEKLLDAAKRGEEIIQGGTEYR